MVVPDNGTSSGGIPQNGGMRLGGSVGVGGGLPGGELQRAKPVAGPSTSSEAGDVPPPPYTETENADSAAGSSVSGAIALPAPVPSYESLVPQGPPVDENEHKYVGLVNQAMTCYLNSLVQTLYMTPEFRNAIYDWEYKYTHSSQAGKLREDMNIPYQIQKLFLLLQTTDKDSLETKDLTSSFGWTSSEAYDQHDVQELCRLMFDALEHRWKNTDHATLIQDLYRGTMEDFVKCLQCRKENTRQDFFLDLPLAVKEFGASEAFHSVEEALKAFVKPEILNGNNQYHCESCNSKQDAHKGLRITQFPYLLTIQLKRFDFDYNTMHRIKLNDRMTFPDVLDLNRFVSQKDILEEPEETEAAAPVRVGSPVDRKEVDKLLQKGEFVYELFSVMVHQGSAAGGHYFAYIKNMDQNNWFCFNDTRVEPANADDISRSFGGSSGGWSVSNTNAYMLMYRKMDPQRNKEFTRTEKLPKHIVDLMARWKQDEEDREREKEREANLVKVRIRLNVPCMKEAPSEEMFELDIAKQTQLSEVFSQAFRKFEPSMSPTSVKLFRKNGRLIRCNGQWQMIQAYVAKNELDSKLESQIAHQSILYRPELNFLLDFKAQNAMFYQLAPSRELKTVIISPVDIVRGVILPRFLVGVSTEEKVIEVKKKLGALLGEGVHDFMLYRLSVEQRATSEGGLIVLDQNNDYFTKYFAGLPNSTPTVFIDGGCCSTPEAKAELAEDRAKKFEDSRMVAILERRKFSMAIRLELPTPEDVSRALSSYHPISTTSTPAESTVAESSTSSSVPPSTMATPLDIPPPPLEECTPSGSGRLSSASSVSSDQMMYSGSLCNNTPQMSPNVSENGDMDLSDPEGPSSDLPTGTFQQELLIKCLERVEDGAWTQPRESLVPSETGTTVGGSDSSSGTLVPWQMMNNDQQIVLVHEENNVLTLDADNRIYVSRLKAWIGQRIRVDPSQFVIVKHCQENDEKGFEYSAKEETREALDRAFGGIYKLSINLRPPLKDDEKVIRVVQMLVEETDKEKWRTLFEVVGAKDTLVGDIMNICRRKYEVIYGRSLTLEQFRLRDTDGNRFAILRPESILDNRGMQWAANIYLQILTDEQVGVTGQSVFIRRFRPSTVEVGPIQEIMVNVKKNANNGDEMRCLLEAIAHVSAIPAEKVKVLEPSLSAWEKWPHAKSRLDLLDSEKFTNIFATDGGQIMSRILGKVVYYRDSSEVPKVLSDDERKQVHIKDAGQPASSRRRERPLRIQMSSISDP